MCKDLPVLYQGGEGEEGVEPTPKDFSLITFEKKNMLETSKFA